MQIQNTMIANKKQFTFTEDELQYMLVDAQETAINRAESASDLFKIAQEVIEKYTGDTNAK